jgi:hypothetical protein
MNDVDWHFLSHVVIRRAGFPFDWLDRLATPRTAGLVADLAADSDTFDSLTNELLREAFPRAVSNARDSDSASQLRTLSRLRARVGRRLEIEADFDSSTLPPGLVHDLEHWSLQRRQLETDRANAAVALETESDGARDALRELSQDADFQQALFLSNPDLYASSLQRLLARPGEQASPAFERKLLAYLQRLCAKNDTASFFGPLNCGRIDAEATEPLSFHAAPGKYSRRDVFIGFWVANRLAQLISSDAELTQFLAPRIHPLCRIEADEVSFPSRNVRARVGPAQQHLLSLVDGQRTVAELSTALGEPLATTVERVRQLVSARVLVCRLEIPSTIFHPFSYLLRRVEGFPPQWSSRQRWIDELRTFESLRHEFVDADLPRRQQLLADMDTWFESTTGDPPRRSAGATYADRSLVYEDCAGTLENFQFSRPFFDDLQQRLSPMLDLCAAHGSLLWRFYQRLGRSVFGDLSPDGSAVPYGRFIDEVRRRPAADPTSDPALQALYTRLRHKVEQVSDGRLARLDGRDLADVLAEVPLERNCHLSPDIMLSAPDLEHLRRGDYQVVLGEIHQVFYAWGSQLYFWPRREAAEAEMAEHVQRMADYEGLATVLNERQHKGLLHETFPGTIVEVAALASESARQRVPISQLDVVLEGERLILRDVRSGRRLRLYTAGDEQLHLWALALPRTMPVPIRMGVHTPRIEVGGVAYQRERWQLPAEEWRPPFAELSPVDLLTRVEQVRRRHGLPRRIFVLAPSEPKPFYIDLESVLSLRLLQPLVDNNPHLVITEMLPGPEQLWLRDQDGSYCCEFRMTACRY